MAEIEPVPLPGPIANTVLRYGDSDTGWIAAD